MKITSCFSHLPEFYMVNVCVFGQCLKENFACISSATERVDWKSAWGKCCCCLTCLLFPGQPFLITGCWADL